LNTDPLVNKGEKGAMLTKDEVKVTVSWNFWRGLRNAIVPALVLWWALLYLIAKYMQ
jgi:hypothetical protein